MSLTRMDRFKLGLVLGVAITALSLLVYVAAQQVYRMSANDPQIQLAEDYAAALRAGANPQSLIPATRVSVADSLAPYAVFFDDSEKQTASSADLDGKSPTMPAGIFDKARTDGESRLTWQPRPGVRSAVVIKYYQGKQSGFVLAGRSLREVEKRESNLLVLVALVWAVTIVATLAVALLV